MTELQKYELIYMGRRYVANGKIGHAFMTVPDWENSTGKTANQLDRDAKIWSLKSSPSVIGGVYSVDGEMTEGRFQIYPKSLAYSRRITHELVDVWEAQDRSLATQQRRKNIERRAAQDTKLSRLIDDLRMVYKKVPVADRLAFQMHIVYELTK